MDILLGCLVAMSALMVSGGSWDSFPTMLRPAVTENDLHFGVTLALDKDYLIVGTNMDDEGDKANVGTVTIFTKVDKQWDEMTKLIPANGGENDKFGSDVNVDNGVIIIGNMQNSIYIYQYIDSTWSETERKTETTSSCGYSVEIYGEYAVYGCPLAQSVKIYKRDPSSKEYFSSGTTWTLTSADGTYFGDSLTMYNAHLAISSKSTVHVYELSTDGLQWNLHTTIDVSPILRKDGAFGRTISMHGDRLVIASKNADNTFMYIYKKGSTSWELEKQFSNTYRGASVSIYTDSIIAGFYDYSGSGTSAGSVQIYKLTDVWKLHTNLLGPGIETGDMFGRSVAVWSNIYVAGAPYDDDSNQDNKGAVYIFDSTAEHTDVILSGPVVLTMSMELYESNSFVKEVESPLVASYDDYIHVSIKESKQNPHFKFIVNTCYATPLASPTTKDVFFDNKCSLESTFDLILQTNDVFNFVFKAFDFIAASGSKIYLHCQIYICLSEDASSSCSQDCSGERFRRSAGNASKIVADLVLASSEIILVASSCSGKTCPSNSKCFDLNRATCICNPGYVFSMRRKACTDERILRINRIRLDVPWVDEYANETSNDFKRISVHKERKLFLVFKRLGADKVIDGVKLVNARKCSTGVVVDVTVTITNHITHRTAYKTFLKCITSNVHAVTSIQTGLSIERDMIPEYTFEMKKPGKTKKIKTLLFIICMICIAILIVSLILFIAYKMKVRRKQAEPKKENETATDDVVVSMNNEPEKNTAC